MIKQKLVLSKAQYNQIINQAIKDAPYETCGIIGGKNGQALEIYPTENVEKDKVKEYRVNDKQLFDIVRLLRKNNLEITAIYHSHPASPAYPSKTDCQRAFYSDSYYLIISLAADKPDARAFRIVNEEISEVEIEIVD
jgi:proteasome lid subunit RPN8/RPN11